MTVSAHTFLDVDFDSGCSASFLDSDSISFVDSCCDFSICFSFMIVFLVSVVVVAYFLCSSKVSTEPSSWPEFLIVVPTSKITLTGCHCGPCNILQNGR